MHNLSLPARLTLALALLAPSSARAQRFDPRHEAADRSAPAPREATSPAPPPAVAAPVAPAPRSPPTAEELAAAEARAEAARARRAFAREHLQFSYLDVRSRTARRRFRGRPALLGEPVLGAQREPLGWEDFFRATGHSDEALTYERRTRRRTALAATGGLALGAGVITMIVGLAKSTRVSCFLWLCAPSFEADVPLLVTGGGLTVAGVTLLAVLGGQPRPFVSSGPRVIGYARDYNLALRRELGLAGDGDLVERRCPERDAGDANEDEDEEGAPEECVSLQAVEPAPPVALTLAPWASPTGAGLSVTGRF